MRTETEKSCGHSVCWPNPRPPDQVTGRRPFGSARGCVLCETRDARREWVAVHKAPHIGPPPLRDGGTEHEHIANPPSPTTCELNFVVLFIVIISTGPEASTVAIIQVRSERCAPGLKPKKKNPKNILSGSVLLREFARTPVV